jgi:hypothetical protein
VDFVAEFRREGITCPTNLFKYSVFHYPSFPSNGLI